MAFDAKKQGRHKEKRMRNSLSGEVEGRYIRIRMGPIFPFLKNEERQPDADVDYLREHLNNKIRDAVGEVLENHETLGFDQVKIDVDVWTG